MDRRDFLRTSGQGLMVWILQSIASDLVRAALPHHLGRPFARDPLPGACLSPLGQTEATLAAMLDTVVPGPATDPEGQPGALEACGMNILLDGSFPFRQYADLFAMLLDGMAEDARGRPFAELEYPDRLSVLLRAQEEMPLLRLAFRAVRSAFFGGAYNGVGLRYVRYPGPCLGWRHVAECSFREPVCRERTSEGWMP